MLPPDAIQRIRDLCDARSLAELADQVRIELEIDGNAATIVEERAPWRADLEWTRLPVARLRFTASTNVWALQVSQTDERRRHYDSTEPTADLQRPLREIDQGPIGIFWG